MADSPFQRDRKGMQPPPTPAAPRQRPGQGSQMISCRATNPLSLNDDLGKVFLDEQQARATTATRLFRNDELFNALAKVVMPAFFAKHRGGKFSMWSTGCSSGEEVYSLAMIALNEFEKNKRPAVMEAFGTDINRNRILEARAGEYGRPSKDSLSQAYWTILNKHAAMDQHSVQMGETLRTVCKFTLFDMRNRPKKHTFHFIVCNHVLQYYDAPGQRHIISNLKAVLNQGGHMYLEGVTEQGLAGSGLKKLATASNLYVVEEHAHGGGLSNPLFRKT